MKNREDIKILCPLCNSMNCFQEACIIEKKQVFSWLCMGCGYTSLSIYKNHSKILKNVLNSSPRIIVELKRYDSIRKIWWFPSIINVPSKGILYPQGTPKRWVWIYTPQVPIPEKDRAKYPIPGTTKYYDYKLDIAQSKSFSSGNFYDALKLMGAIVSSVGGQ